MNAEPMPPPSTAGAVDLNELKDNPSTPEPTPEEYAQLIRDNAAALGQHEFDNLTGKNAGGVEILCPGTVVPIHGQAITSHHLNSMVISGLGVFIVGTVNNREKDEVSRLIFDDNLSHIDYDFNLMRKLLDEAAEKHIAEQQGGDDDDTEPA